MQLSLLAASKGTWCKTRGKTILGFVINTLFVSAKRDKHLCLNGTLTEEKANYFHCVRRFACSFSCIIYVFISLCLFAFACVIFCLFLSAQRMRFMLLPAQLYNRFVRAAVLNWLLRNGKFDFLYLPLLERAFIWSVSSQRNPFIFNTCSILT